MDNNQQKRTLVLFTDNLRLQDNPALYHAAERGEVVGLYVLDDTDPQHALGGASRWWLHHSLASLESQLASKNIPLLFSQGETLQALTHLLEQLSVDGVFFQHSYLPGQEEKEQAIAALCESNNIECRHFEGQLLFPSRNIRTQQDKPFQVFTPFWKACLAQPEPGLPLPEPKTQAPTENITANTDTLALADLDLLPKINWAEGMAATWQPGEDGAHQRLSQFLEHSVSAYKEARDIPGINATSKLSPHLRFGEISPRMIWHQVQQAMTSVDQPLKGHEHFLRELGWREFSYHLLHHFPFMLDRPMRSNFTDFPWPRTDTNQLKAWQQGQTGIPLVDAGMRELWQTGWMHNRVRMIVGSLLTKNLMIHWLEGANWFWDTLVDADMANNTASWQWVAGCGADAAPYFRIFNPVTQGKKFDPEGEYVKRYVPELAGLPAKHIHEPWLAPEEVLQSAGIQLDQDYPRPIVDLAESRKAALAAYEVIRA